MGLRSFRFLFSLFFLVLISWPAAGCLATIGARQEHIGELSCHFLPVYFSFSLYSLLIVVGCLFYVRTVAMRVKWPLVLALSPLLFSTVFCANSLAPYVNWNKSQVLPGDQEISILHLNLWGGRNRDKESLFYLIKEKNPDLLAFCEIEDSWGKLLDDKLAKTYPHRAMFHRNGGVALFSKYPILSSQLKMHGPKCRPRWLIKARLPEGTVVSLVVAHPPTPVGAKERFIWRNEEFALYAEELQKMGPPSMLIGDLNCSPWSPYLQDLTGGAGLSQGNKGLGLSPTWPRMFIYPGAILQIDHVLMSQHFVVIKKEVLPPVGSDHLPLYVRAVLRKTTPRPGASPSCI